MGKTTLWAACFAVAALLGAACAPGTPDLGFSPTGLVTYGPSFDTGGPTSLVPLADGSVVATRSSTRPLTRIDAGGGVDPSWGAGLPTDCRTSGRAVADGAGILFGCSHLSPPSGPLVWQLWRVTAAGALDPAFGGDGIVDVPPALGAFDAVPLAGGGYLGIGWSTTRAPSLSEAPLLVVLVYSASGTIVGYRGITLPVPTLPVPSFGGWGADVRLAPTPTGVAVLETARSVGAGIITVSVARIQHLSATAVPLDDPPLGGPTAGSRIGNDEVTGFHVLGDGRTVSVGSTSFVDVELLTTGTSSWMRVRRPDGSPDPSFGTGGEVVLLATDGGQFRPDALAVSSGDGALVVAGAIAGAPHVAARYDAATGALDPTFGNHGFSSVAVSDVAAAAARTGAPQVYLGGRDGANRPAVTRVWNQGG